MARILVVDGFNMDRLRLADVLPLAVEEATDSWVQMEGPGLTVYLGGAFTYANGLLSGGNLTFFGWSMAEGGSPETAWPTFSANGFSVPVSTMLGWLASQDTNAALSSILGGDDVVDVQYNFVHIGNLIRTYDGNDTVNGVDGDTVFGGAGNDKIIVHNDRTLGPNPWLDARSYVRGDEGNDTIQGGIGFDDINGNAGDDVARGGFGNDWVVGGKDQDLLFGDDGDDIVYGNLGEDTCNGGAGADLIRGGQGNDSLAGGAGNDWLSGDRGDDTVSGGAGADIFHTFNGAGIDRVVDFSLAEGDRVQLDVGTAYSVLQVGADTIIDLGNGDKMVVVGVLLSSLPSNWIFVS